ncbi:hypothetical protein Clacol_007403 [Clathrus columnatus]|uniref:laccase n=1 Tax=Clathrus columnatus TaxID=1419009 RepID=A0AAV5AHM8_9AGAM|nr:hypothetical protein Clacol_007403 [Clathrus columnatus]
MLCTVGFLFALLSERIYALQVPEPVNHKPPTRPSGPTHTIQDVEHVVLFMQENRAFDHYFGTMAGVRGFGDPNVAITREGKPSWYQKVDSSLSNKTTALLPFYLNAAGGNLTQSTQCMTAGSNGWTANHDALNNNDNNLWAEKNSPFSLGFYKREDLPIHFAIAEAYTLGDMYAESVIASTDPNRVMWISGSVNIPGGPQKPEQGGPTVDNNETPGCDSTGVSCFPLKWSTFPEHLQAANVSWQLYQDRDNFDDNPLAWFEQFQTAPAQSPLAQKGVSFLGLDAFFAAAANGSLPKVSYIIGAEELSEHPPFGSDDGSFLQALITNAIINSPKYNSTVLMISYDESGGWSDQFDPFMPNGTGATVAGPGFRLPFYVISPWTRGGYLFTGYADHTSQLLFLSSYPLQEKWLAAKGTPVKTPEINSWRRENMDDLTKMFDFAHPDYSKPDIPTPPVPTMNSQGQFINVEICLNMFPQPAPPVPYGEQTRENSLLVENGYKIVRGSLTEGRFLVFETNGVALAYDRVLRGLSLAPAPPLDRLSSSSDNYRFVLHATMPPPSTLFKLQFAGAGATPTYVDKNLRATTSINNAATFNITDTGNGEGYTIRDVTSSQFFSLANLEEIIINSSPRYRVVYISGSINEEKSTEFGNHNDVFDTTQTIVTSLNEFNPALTADFPSLLNPEAHTSRPAISHSWTWVVRYEPQWAPDGVTKGVYTVNNQFPGPTIEVRSGDRIILTVKNELPNGETAAIHFHGIRHLGSNAMDGAIGVTQCPIPVNNSFTYDFTIDEKQSGTYWYGEMCILLSTSIEEPFFSLSRWHSHSGDQRADGLYGAFIIHKPTSPLYDSSVSSMGEHSTPQENPNADEEHLIMIGDWYHRTAHEMVDWYKSKKSVGWEPTPENVLFNGVNTFDCSRLIRLYECDLKKGRIPLIALNSDSRRRKKFRVINVGNLADIEVSVGSHTLIIVEADGSPVRVSPDPVSSVTMSPGQRYSFYIEYMGDTPINEGESFWMRMRVNKETLNMPNTLLNAEQFIPIFYNDPRYLPRASIPPTRDFSILSDTAQPSFDLFQLAPFEQVPLPAADIQIMIYINTMMLDRLGGIPYGYVNQSSWVPDLGTPMLLRNDLGKGMNANNKNKGAGGWATEHELVYVTDRRETKVIEIIINNLDDGPHPFHLHGHHFYPLKTFKSKIGWGSYDYKTGHDVPHFAPVLRDTMSIPRRGHAVIRFVADAPGMWLFHCHVLVHLSSG